MNPKHVPRKLIGTEEERAVSPVIGVILMVAITVILAAVIAAFVLDLGQSVDQDAQAGVTIDVDESSEEVQVEVTSMGNADYVNLSSSDWGNDLEGGEENITELSVGDVVTLQNESHINETGTVSAVAVIEESDTETSVASEDWDFE